MSENITLLNIEDKDNSWSSLATSAINDCPKIKKDREREILISRFGISGNAETLQAIGTHYGITRERVRQIIANAIKKIQKNCESKEVKSNLTKIESFVKEGGSYISLNELYEKFSNEDEVENNSLRFIASLSQNLDHVKNSHDLREGFRVKTLKTTELKSVSKEAVKFLRENKKTFSAKNIGKSIGQDINLTRAALAASNQTILTDNNKWGLLSWPHINPKSIRDKSKYIMKRHGKPIHYGDLAEKITEIGSKDVTKQSVHNELIKNSDFVLVGRGIYALSEWGYKPGIVEEVIVEVLEYENKPLHKDVIIERVLEKRIVKPSTIVLNLQKPKFKKVGKATYTIN
jgi:hypothetical protein